MTNYKSKSEMRRLEIMKESAQPAEPREFWIKACVAHETEAQAKEHLRGLKRPIMYDAPIVHVIEYAAYKALVKEVESLRDQLQWSLKNEEQYKQAFLNKSQSKK
jgi:hypothetical protein